MARMASGESKVIKMELNLESLMNRCLEKVSINKLFFYTPWSLTAILPLKNDGWKEDDLASYWVSVTFQGLLLLSFRGTVCISYCLHLFLRHFFPSQLRFALLGWWVEPTRGIEDFPCIHRWIHPPIQPLPSPDPCGERKQGWGVFPSGQLADMPLSLTWPMAKL